MYLEPQMCTTKPSAHKYLVSTYYMVHMMQRLERAYYEPDIEQELNRIRKFFQQNLLQ
jgi:hypothetical protein